MTCRILDRIASATAVAGRPSTGDRRSHPPARHLLLALALLVGGRLEATTIPETTPADDNQPNGNCTLREAIIAAQANTAVDLCPAGSDVEPDVVVLLAGPHSWTLGQIFQSANGGALVLRGPETTPPTALINIDPVSSQRFMRLLNGTRLTIENVDFRNGDTRLNQSTRTGGALTAVDLTDVALTLRNVVMQGNRSGFGGGLHFETSAGCSPPCELTIERSVFQANLAEVNDVAATPQGGGAMLQLRGPISARVVDSEFLFNSAATTRPGNGAWGGALYVGLSGPASFEMRRTSFVGNVADAGDGITPMGAGAVVYPWGESTAVVEDLHFEANSLVAPFDGGFGYSASALYVNCAFTGSFALDRIEIVNHDAGEVAVGVRLENSSPQPCSARNVLVARGPQRGAQVTTNGGDIALAHWTVTNHGVEGLRLAQNSAALRLDNSILWGNPTDLAQSGGPTIDPSNLIGVDPLFENAAGDDYRLSALSPAIDAGDQTLSSTGALDLDHAPRVAGLDTDAGGYERGALFGDGFESGDLGAWSETVP